MEQESPPPQPRSSLPFPSESSPPRAPASLGALTPHAAPEPPLPHGKRAAGELAALAAETLDAAPAGASPAELLALLSASTHFSALVDLHAAPRGALDGCGSPGSASPCGASEDSLERSAAPSLSNASGVSVLAREQLAARALRALQRHARRAPRRRGDLCAALEWWRTRALTVCAPRSPPAATPPATSHRRHGGTAVLLAARRAPRDRSPAAQGALLRWATTAAALAAARREACEALARARAGRALRAWARAHATRAAARAAARRGALRRAVPRWAAAARATAAWRPYQVRTAPSPASARAANEPILLHPMS
jgi:hypothetical protein